MPRNNSKATAVAPQVDQDKFDALMAKFDAQAEQFAMLVEANNLLRNELRDAKNQVAILKAEQEEKINERYETFQKRSMPGKAWNLTSRGFDGVFLGADAAITFGEESLGLVHKDTKEVISVADMNLASWVSTAKADLVEETSRELGKLVTVEEIKDPSYLLALKLSKVEEDLKKEWAKKK